MHLHLLAAGGGLVPESPKIIMAYRSGVDGYGDDEDNVSSRVIILGAKRCEETTCAIIG